MNNKLKEKEIVTAIGLMSGTSFDAVDAAVIRTDGEDHVELMGGIMQEYPQPLSDKLKSIQNASLNEILEIEALITTEHIRAVQSLISAKRMTFKDIDIIGFHGQTVIHNPSTKITCQLGDPNMLAYRCGIDVVSDFRRKDIAAGGNGAPLIPIFHKSLAKNFKSPVVFLNIGGVSNITFVNGNEIIAFDTGPGNAPLNDFIEHRLNVKFDMDGLTASKGECLQGVVSKFLTKSYFQLPYPKSLDRNHFNYEFLDNMRVKDGLATLCHIIVESIKMGIKSLPQIPKQILVFGGGRKNLFIMELLQKALSPVEISIIDKTKFNQQPINGDILEAYAFGYLAVRSLKRLHISFPTTTKAPMPLSGGSFYFA